MKIKRIIAMFLLLGMISQMPILAAAEEVINGDLSPGEPGFVDRKDSDQYKQDKMYYVPEGYVGTNIDLNLPIYMQKNDYFGGPACVEMVLDYILGPVNKQEIYADFMGTTKEGTEIESIVKALNHYQKDYTYTKKSMDSKYHLVNCLVESLNNRRGVVADISTKEAFKDGKWNYSMPGHYVLITGFEVTKDEKTYITVIDPYMVGKKKVLLEDFYQMLTDHWDRAIIY